jgi:hypothetical protein
MQVNYTDKTEGFMLTETASLSDFKYSQQCSHSVYYICSVLEFNV